MAEPLAYTCLKSAWVIKMLLSTARSTVEAKRTKDSPVFRLGYHTVHALSTGVHLQTLLLK
jgi:hypothetical protein